MVCVCGYKCRKSSEILFAVQYGAERGSSRELFFSGRVRSILHELSCIGDTLHIYILELTDGTCHADYFPLYSSI